MRARILFACLYALHPTFYTHAQFTLRVWLGSRTLAACRSSSRARCSLTSSFSRFPLDYVSEIRITAARQRDARLSAASDASADAISNFRLAAVQGRVPPFARERILLSSFSLSLSFSRKLGGLHARNARRLSEILKKIGREGRIARAMYFSFPPTGGSSNLRPRFRECRTPRKCGGI